MRERFAGLVALSITAGCGSPPQPFDQSTARGLDAVADVPVEYLAILRGYQRAPEQIVDERGVFRCRETYNRGADVGAEPHEDPACPNTILRALQQHRPILIVSNGAAHSLTKENFASFFGAIDSPEKVALYAVQLLGLGVVTVGGIRKAEGGFEVLVDSSEGGTECFVETTRYTYRSLYLMSPKGELTLRSKDLLDSQPVTNECHPLGRRPRAFADVVVPGSFEGWARRARHREAASVTAFHELARALARFGAPRAMVRRAAAAAVDEQRHANAFRALQGLGAPAPPRGTVAPPPDELEEVAIENVVEGLVLEGFAARVAAWQADHARAASVRAAFARIAPEEAGHARLSADVHRWAARRLSAPANRRVRDARREAEQGLRRAVREREDTPITRLVGEPPAEDARRLVRG